MQRRRRWASKWPSGCHRGRQRLDRQECASPPLQLAPSGSRSAVSQRSGTCRTRERAMDLIRREVEAARGKGLAARLLVPLTRPPGAPALQFEIELKSLDQFETFRHQGVSAGEETGSWMHTFSEILI